MGAADWNKPESNIKLIYLAEGLYLLNNNLNVEHQTPKLCIHNKRLITSNQSTPTEC